MMVEIVVGWFDPIQGCCWRKWLHLCSDEMSVRGEDASNRGTAVSSGKEGACAASGGAN